MTRRKRWFLIAALALTGLLGLAWAQRLTLLTDYFSDEAVTAIRRNKHRPFFLYLAHWGVHTPPQWPSFIGLPVLIDKTLDQQQTPADVYTYWYN